MNYAYDIGYEAFYEGLHLFYDLLQMLKSVPGLDGHGGNASADVFVHFVAGGLAGVTAASATYPLDLIRTRLAAQVQK